MKRLRKHANVLKVLASANPKLKKAIIEGADSQLIKCLCDCANNILKGNVSMPNCQKTKLRRHKQSLRLLTQRQSLARKKKVLQTGGFLGTLLTPILGILGSLLGG